MYKGHFSQKLIFFQWCLNSAHSGVSDTVCGKNKRRSRVWNFLSLPFHWCKRCSLVFLLVSIIVPRSLKFKRVFAISLFRPKWAKDIIFLTLKIAQICSQKYSWICMWRNVPKRSKVYQIEIETVSQKINIRFNILPPCCKLWSSSPVRQSWTVPFAE